MATKTRKVTWKAVKKKRPSSRKGIRKGCFENSVSTGHHDVGEGEQKHTKEKVERVQKKTSGDYEIGPPNQRETWQS